MIPSNSSNSSNSSNMSNPGPGAHRSLNEDVLQSAEDAVASEGADDYAGLSRGDYVARSGGLQSPYTGTVMSDTSGTSSLGLDTQEKGFFTRMESQLTRYVANEPAKAALMAAGAGVLLALVVGKRSKGRR